MQWIEFYLPCIYRLLNDLAFDLKYNDMNQSLLSSLGFKMQHFLICLGFFFFGQNLLANCQSEVNVEIPQQIGLGISSTITNSGSVGLLGSEIQIEEVCLLIQHGRVMDLEVYLEGPSGASVIVYNGSLIEDSNNAIGDNLGNLFSETEVCFTMDAIQEPADFYGSAIGDWLPVESYNAFDGEDPNGDWTLRVVDLADPPFLIIGTWKSWSIGFSNGDCQDELSNCPFEYPAPDSVGFTGLGQSYFLSDDPAVLSGYPEPFFSDFEAVFVGDGLDIPANQATAFSIVVNSFEADDVVVDASQISISMELEHAWLGDLSVYLTSPSGETVVIFDQIGVPQVSWLGSDDALSGNYYFSANASNFMPIVTESGLVSEGEYLIEGDFADFIGCSMNGEWILEILDSHPGSFGTLYAWELVFQENFNPMLSSSSFSGPGIVDDGDSLSTALFYPDLAGSGVHEIIYTYLHPDNILYADTQFVTVYDPIFLSPIDTQFIHLSNDSLLLSEFNPIDSSGTNGEYNWYSDAELSIFIPEPSYVDQAGRYFVEYISEDGRRDTTSLFLMYEVNSSDSVWLRDGATWLVSSSFEGSTYKGKSVVDGDTIINGYPLKIIRAYGMSVQNIEPPDTTSYSEGIKGYGLVDGDKVYQYKDSSLILSYDFTMEIGDSMVYSFPCEFNDSVTFSLLELGTELINGTEIRYQLFEVLEPVYTIYIGENVKIYEGLGEVSGSTGTGYSGFFFYKNYACIAVDPASSFYCYRDGDRSYPEGNGCEDIWVAEPFDPGCTFNNLKINSRDCGAFDSYLGVGFNYEGLVSDSVEVLISGDETTNPNLLNETYRFAYEDLPDTLIFGPYPTTFNEFGPLDEAETIWGFEVTVRDLEQNLCSVSKELLNIESGEDCGVVPCSITADAALRLESLDTCTFYIEGSIDFNPYANNDEEVYYSMVGEDSIPVFRFLYSGPSQPGLAVYSFGPFYCSDYEELCFEFSFMDCLETVCIDGPTLDDYCVFNNLTIEAIECEMDTLFSIDFSYVGETTDSFHLINPVDENIIGSFDYQSLPLEIEMPDYGGEIISSLRVIDEGENCSKSANVNYGTCLGYERHYEINTSVSLFPNPADDFVYIKANEIKINAISIYSNEGALLFRTKENFSKIATDFLPSNTYIFEIEAIDGAKYLERILIFH